MQADIIQDTEIIIAKLVKAAGSISNRALRIEVKGWLTIYADTLSELGESDPRISTALNYFQGSIHNERLIKKDWLKNLRIVKKQLHSPQEKINLSFDPNQPFTAYKILQALFSSAKTEILIYDGYVEDKTLGVLATVNPSCKIRILANNLYGNFEKELKLFKKQFNNTEARKNSLVHDRFFVIDGKNFIIGTSLHSVGGKKHTHIFESNGSVGKILTNHFEQLWLQSHTI